MFWHWTHRERWQITLLTRKFELVFTALGGKFKFSAQKSYLVPSETETEIGEKIIKMLLRKGFGPILNRRGGCAGAGHKRSRFYQAANLATATINIARCTIAECKHAQTLIKLGRCKPYYSHVVYSNGLRPLEQPRRTAQELGQCFWNTFLWQRRELYLLAPPGLQL